MICNDWCAWSSKVVMYARVWSGLAVREPALTASGDRVVAAAFASKVFSLSLSL